MPESTDADRERAQEIQRSAGMEQCWCDLTRSEIGCPTCRSEGIISAAIAAAREEGRRAGIEEAKTKRPCLKCQVSESESRCRLCDDAFCEKCQDDHEWRCTRWARLSS